MMNDNIYRFNCVRVGRRVEIMDNLRREANGVEWVFAEVLSGLSA